MMDKDTMLLDVRVPRPVLSLLRRLEDAGYEAAVVGGCVRDTLLGVTPNDWDICTSARPEETRRCLAGLPLIGTGEKHGTIAAVIDGAVYEITTYRVDGAYSDGRHPDSVTFSRDLREDLARRDFTINAMAMIPERGPSDASDGSDGSDVTRCRAADPFGGLEDLRRGLIRAVGDPQARLREDALRIMRAYRFSAVLGFPLEEKTARACGALADSVRHVSQERVLVELTKLAAGKRAADVCVTYREPLSRAVGVPLQDARMLAALDRMPPEPAVRIAALFGPRSVDALTRLKAPKKLIRAAGGIWSAYTALGGAAGASSAARTDLKDLLRTYGEEQARGALSIAAAEDCGAHAAEEILEDILRSGECWSRGQLAVTGQDLTARGVRGPAVGETLERLLDAVIEGTCPNEKAALLAEAGLAAPADGRGGDSGRPE